MENQRQVSLVDLFWKVMFGWRSMLVCAVVFTLLLGLYSGRNYMNAKAAYEQAMEEAKQPVEVQDGEVDVNAVLAGLSEAEKAGVIRATDNYKLDSIIGKYIQDSVCMTMNPLDTTSFSMDILVSTENKGEDITLGKLYYNYITGGKLAKDLAVKLGSDEKTIQELISVGLGEVALNVGLGEIGSSLTTDFYVKHPLNVSFDGGLVSFKMLVPDSFDAAMLETEAKACLEAYRAELMAQVGKHEITYYNECLLTEVNDEFERYMTNLVTLRDKYLNSWTSLYNTFTSDQKMAFGKLVDSEKSEDSILTSGQSEPVAPSLKSSLIKYCVLGFVLGIFLAAVWLVCITLFSAKLQRADELVTLFGFRSIGNILLKEHKGIDKWLFKLQTRNTKQLDMVTRLDIVCSNIEILCEKKEIKQLAITGTAIESFDEKVLNEIISDLKKAGIEARVIGNVCYDMASLREIVATKNAIVIESVGASCYSEIEKEVIALNENDIHVLGAVAVEM